MRRIGTALGGGAGVSWGGGFSPQAPPPHWIRHWSLAKKCVNTPPLTPGACEGFFTGGGGSRKSKLTSKKNTKRYCWVVSLLAPVEVPVCPCPYPLDPLDSQNPRTHPRGVRRIFGGGGGGGAERGGGVPRSAKEANNPILLKVQSLQLSFTV